MCNKKKAKKQTWFFVLFFLMKRKATFATLDPPPPAIHLDGKNADTVRLLEPAIHPLCLFVLFIPLPSDLQSIVVSFLCFSLEMRFSEASFSRLVFFATLDSSLYLECHSSLFVVEEEKKWKQKLSSIPCYKKNFSQFELIHFSWSRAQGVGLLLLSEKGQTYLFAWNRDGQFCDTGMHKSYPSGLIGVGEGKEHFWILHRRPLLDVEFLCCQISYDLKHFSLLREKNQFFSTYVCHSLQKATIHCVEPSASATCPNFLIRRFQTQGWQCKTLSKHNAYYSPLRYFLTCPLFCLGKNGELIEGRKNVLKEQPDCFILCEKQKQDKYENRRLVLF